MLLLSNMPTRLTVDRLVTWDALMPDRLEQAILRTGGVLPLSASEMARVFPDLWPSAEAAKMWRSRGDDGKGVTSPNNNTYWGLLPLSEATVVTYRRPGQSRGSPHRAVLPGQVEDAAAAEAALAAVLGEVEKVQVVELLRRPGADAEATATAPPATSRQRNVPRPPTHPRGPPPDAASAGPRPPAGRGPPPRSPPDTMASEGGSRS